MKASLAPRPSSAGCQSLARSPRRLEPDLSPGHVPSAMSPYTRLLSPIPMSSVSRSGFELGIREAHCRTRHTWHSRRPHRACAVASGATRKQSGDRGRRGGPGKQLGTEIESDRQQDAGRNGREESREESAVQANMGPFSGRGCNPPWHAGGLGSRCGALANLESRTGTIGRSWRHRCSRNLPARARARGAAQLAGLPPKEIVFALDTHMRSNLSQASVV